MEIRPYRSADIAALAELMGEMESELVTLTSGIKPERVVAHRFYENFGYAKNGYRFVKTLPNKKQERN